MEKRDHSPARNNLILFVVLAAAIYVILVTVFIATLYRFTVKQSAKIQTLEAIADDLAARVYKLETRFTAQATEENDEGGTDHEHQEAIEKRRRNKQIHSYPPQTRNKRQFQGFALQTEGGL